MRKCIIALFLLYSHQNVLSQKLHSGYDPIEYFELLKISSQQGDTLYNPGLPFPEQHTRTYRSAIMGLDNRWELWESKDSVAVISIRGTTKNQLSWVENFFSAMVPASGKIKLSTDFEFDYKLAEDKDAAVHIGWLTAVGFLGRDMLPKIDSLKLKGTKEFLIIGHSQGGAIAILLAAYFENLKMKRELDPTIVFKTYSSAGPKPGNLFFAYDFETKTQNGWAFNVVNTADWVPEGPFSIQTTDDFNASNPFRLVKSGLKKLPFKQKIILRKIYTNLEKPPKKANKRYQKYLGSVTFPHTDIGDLTPGFLSHQRWKWCEPWITPGIWLARRMAVEIPIPSSIRTRGSLISFDQLCRNRTYWE